MPPPTPPPVVYFAGQNRQMSLSQQCDSWSCTNRLTNDWWITELSTVLLFSFNRVKFAGNSQMLNK